MIEYVDESEIVAMAADSGDGSNFHKVLAIGQKFKDAKCTPIYLYDNDESLFRVHAKEYFGRRLQ